jgi:hypothetical protein
MSKKKKETAALLFVQSPGKYNLAYFKGDKAEIELELALILIEDGLAILDEAPAAPADEAPEDDEQ